MNARSRYTLIACSGLAVGFALGWITRSTPALFNVEVLVGRSVMPLPTQGARVHPAPRAQSTPLPPASRLRSGVEILAWLEEHDFHLAVHPFNADAFDPKLAALLDLSPAEVDQINGALRQTKQRLDELAIQTATSKVSPDGKLLTVMVSPLPAQGDALYANLLGTIKKVLGPDRFQLFDQIAGAGFDGAFDRYGLNPVTYELSLEPSDTQVGGPVYNYKRYFVGADGKSSGWGSGVLSRSAIEATFPVLAHFLPADFGNQAPPPTPGGG